METKRKSTETRRREIKRIVLNLAFTEGLAKLTTSNIAKHVGISEGAIFKHFKSKRDILLSILEDVKEDLGGGLKKIVSKDITAQKRLYEFMCFHIDYLKKNRGVTILLFSEASYENNSNLKTALYDILNLQKSYISKIISDGIANGEFNSLISEASFVSLYMGIPISMNIEINLNSEVFNHDEFCENMFLLLGKILGLNIQSKSS